MQKKDQTTPTWDFTEEDEGETDTFTTPFSSPTQTVSSRNLTDTTTAAE